jgi:hypothetical protein
MKDKNIKDFEQLKRKKLSIFHNNEDYDFKHSKPVHITVAFKKQFPILTLLVEQARVLDVIIKKSAYKLLSWDEKNSDTSMGWLCKAPANYPPLPFLEEHRMLADCIGGIFEVYCNNEADRLDMNQNFMFIPEYCEQGLGKTRESYEHVCSLYKVEPITTEHLLEFAHEAGGIHSFYDPNTAEVLIYAPDHSSTYLLQLPNQCEFTFYTIRGIRTFTDYVETLAQQWLDWVK